MLHQTGMYNQEFQLTQQEAEQDTAKLPPSPPKTQLLCRGLHMMLQLLQQLNCNTYMSPKDLPGNLHGLWHQRKFVATKDALKAEIPAFRTEEKI